MTKAARHPMTGMCKGRADRLVCTVTVVPFHKGDTPKRVSEKNSVRGDALFDTGATRSVISEKLASDLRLVQVGRCSVGTAGGRVIQSTYMATFVLPNTFIISGIQVTAAPLPADVDALIGMDIITLGDFAITKHKGDTVFSFQIPSTHCIDFCAD